MPTSEAKCTVEIEPVETERVVATVKVQLKAMGRKDLLAELESEPRVSVTVLKLENVPTVKNVVLIGRESKEVKDIKLDDTDLSMVRIGFSFRTPEESDPNTCIRVTIGSNPYQHYFNQSRMGDVDVDYRRVGTTDRGNDGNHMMQAVLTPSLIAQVSLPDAYYAEDCIVVAFSNAVNARLISGGIRVQPPFAIVQNVRA